MYIFFKTNKFLSGRRVFDEDQYMLSDDFDSVAEALEEASKEDTLFTAGIGVVLDSVDAPHSLDGIEPAFTVTEKKPFMRKARLEVRDEAGNVVLSVPKSSPLGSEELAEFLVRMLTATSALFETNEVAEAIAEAGIEPVDLPNQR